MFSWEQLHKVRINTALYLVSERFLIQFCNIISWFFVCFKPIYNTFIYFAIVKLEAGCSHCYPRRSADNAACTRSNSDPSKCVSGLYYCSNVENTYVGPCLLSGNLNYGCQIYQNISSKLVNIICSSYLYLKRYYQKRHL